MKQSISSLEGIVCSFQVYLAMKFRFRKKKNKPPVIFDSSFYVENHRELIAGQDPYQHYCDHGCRLGLDPNPVFSTRYYQDTHLASDHSANPIEHYLANAKGQPVLDTHPLFDSLSYVEQIEGLDPSVTPLEHFQQHNSTNLASPSVFFDTRKYIERYPEVGPSGFNGLYHFLRFGKKQGRLKSVALNLIQGVMQREQRPASHQFVGDTQRDISFLASLLGLDRDKPTIVLAAESADFKYAYLLKKISLCYGSSYDANVVHLFGRDSDATDEFSPLGPTASQDTDPDHPYLEFGNQLLFEIVDHINAVGTVSFPANTGQFSITWSILPVNFICWLPGFWPTVLLRRLAKIAVSYKRSCCRLAKAVVKLQTAAMPGSQSPNLISNPPTAHHWMPTMLKRRSILNRRSG